MAGEAPITFGTRCMATVCRLCPVCILARRRPGGALARKLAQMERTCPFCRAYRRVQARGRRGSRP